jgi:RND family efflux transporter MFP subunit
VAAAVNNEALTQTRRFSGEVWAVSEAALTVGEAGRVRRVLVGEGAKVKSGELLLELDDSLARAELGVAVAERQRAEQEQSYAAQEAQRFEALEKEQIATTIEAERGKSEAKARMAQEKGAVAAGSRQVRRIERHRIVAPFDGTVTSRNVDPGDWLEPGEPALGLVTAERLEVLVRVPAEILDALGSLVSVSLADGGRTVAATLSHSVDALDRKTRTALLRLEPVERPAWLRAGASVDVMLGIERRDGTLVPRDAIVYGITNTQVIRVKDGTAEPVPVSVLAAEGEQVLIARGPLSVGDQLVVRGNERLRPGQALTLGEAIAPALSAASESKPADKAEAPDEPSKAAEPGRWKLRLPPAKPSPSSAASPNPQPKSSAKKPLSASRASTSLKK